MKILIFITTGDQFRRLKMKYLLISLLKLLYAFLQHKMRPFRIELSGMATIDVDKRTPYELQFLTFL